MKFLSLDLEMNQPSGRIIQVGVALGDELQAMEEWTVRRWYLDPGEPVAEPITQLTGVTNEDIARHAQSAHAVAAQIGALVDEHQPFVNPVTWGGGDSTALKALFEREQVPFPYFGRRWLDVKTVYVCLRLAQGKKPTGGLRSALAEFKLRFVGEPHRADADALNTLQLFFELQSRQRTLHAAPRLLKQL